VSMSASPAATRTAFGMIGPSGLVDDGLPWVVEHRPQTLATNLADFLDERTEDRLSAQAAAGLIVRCVRSGQLMPRDLFDVLSLLASERNATLRPSRGNSFEALDAMAEAVANYRELLPAAADYNPNVDEDEDSAPGAEEDDDADE